MTSTLETPTISSQLCLFPSHLVHLPASQVPSIIRKPDSSLFHQQKISFQTEVSIQTIQCKPDTIINRKKKAPNTRVVRYIIYT